MPPTTPHYDFLPPFLEFYKNNALPCILFRPGHFQDRTTPRRCTGRRTVLTNSAPPTFPSSTPSSPRRWSACPAFDTTPPIATKDCPPPSNPQPTHANIFPNNKFMPVVLTRLCNRFTKTPAEKTLARPFALFSSAVFRRDCRFNQHPVF
jgi:hypothetical protein